MDPGDRITAAYHRVWEDAGELAGLRVERDEEMTLVATGPPISFFNRAFVDRDVDDVPGALERATGFFGSRPFLFETREALHPRAQQGAKGKGLAVALSAPGMVLDVTGLTASEGAPDGLEIRPVVDESDLDINLEVQARGFGIPPEVVSGVFKVPFQGDNARCFTGWCDGKPVASSGLVVHDGLAGVYSVATVDGFRGRGFGEALTVAAVRHGAEEFGCTTAYLQSSPMGKGIYERMGFRTVTTYTGYECPA